MIDLSPQFLFEQSRESLKDLHRKALSDSAALYEDLRLLTAKMRETQGRWINARATVEQLEWFLEHGEEMVVLAEKKGNSNAKTFTPVDMEPYFAHWRSLRRASKQR